MVGKRETIAKSYYSVPKSYAFEELRKGRQNVKRQEQNGSRLYAFVMLDCAFK